MTRFVGIGSTLFVLGLLGMVRNRRSMLVILRSMELRLVAVNLRLVAQSVALDDLVGQMFSRLVLTVAAAESAMGLAILVVYYRVRGTLARGSAALRHG
jgi:NADH-quinone oxidoreductase subunit K